MSGLRLERASAILGLFVIAVEGVQLAMWLVAPQALTPLLLDHAATKPTTLVGFLLLGVVLAFPMPGARRSGCAVGGRPARARGHPANLLDRPLLAADLLYVDAWRVVGPTGQMALASGLVLLALALALALAAQHPRAASLLAAVAYALGFVSLVGHLYGSRVADHPADRDPMAVPTVPVALASAVAVLLHRPDLPVSRALRARVRPASCCGGTSAGRWRCRRRRLAGRPGRARRVVGPGVRPGTARARAHRRHGGRRRAGRPDRSARASTRARPSRTGNGCSSCSTARRSGSSRPRPDGRRRYVNRRWRELTGAIASDGADGEIWPAVRAPRRPRLGCCRAGRRRWSTAVSTSVATATYVPTAPSRWVDSNATAIRGRRRQGGPVAGQRLRRDRPGRGETCCSRTPSAVTARWSRRWPRVSCSRTHTVSSSP